MIPILDQLAGLTLRTSHQAPRGPVAPKHQRMADAYAALPEVGRRDTREVAAAIGASVHSTGRALERLVEKGRVRKAGTKPAGNTFVNLWERT